MGKQKEGTCLGADTGGTGWTGFETSTLLFFLVCARDMFFKGDRSCSFQKLKRPREGDDGVGILHAKRIYSTEQMKIQHD